MTPSAIPPTTDEASQCTVDERLRDACTYGDFAAAEQAIAAGADVNAVDSEGYVPLIRAVANEHEAIVQLLLSRGADPNIASHSEGQTAIFFAAQVGRWSVGERLIAAGADVSWIDATGRNALSVAFWVAAEGKQQPGAEAVRGLVAAGCDLMHQDNLGATVAHQAVVWNCVDRLQALSGHPKMKGMLSLRARAGKTPLQRACEAKDVHTCRALIELGADPNENSSTGEPLLGSIFRSGNQTGALLLLACGATPLTEEQQRKLPAAGGGLDVRIGASDPIQAAIMLGDRQILLDTLSSCLDGLDTLDALAHVDRAIAGAKQLALTQGVDFALAWRNHRSAIALLKGLEADINPARP